MRAATSQPTGRRRTRYRYSPALDGVRGTAMVLFMAFHFGFTWLQGAWVGINLFFVLSAFLITRLLVEERVEWGRIDVLAFYRRRARRLLPALFLLLAALCVYGLTLASTAVRRPMRSDVLATLLYVQNWHLLVNRDQYFQTFNPSYLRHAWTLAVEEQFYLIVPAIMTVLLLTFRRREAQAAALLVLGALSAVWTARIGVATQAAQSHAYYGTDTRAQALCIGAALGVWLAPRANGDSPRRPPRRVVAALGWSGLAAMAFAYLGIEPFAPWMFDDGGMYVFAMASAALVLGCADPRSSMLRRVLGWRPFAYLGKLSYSLYLWHWPIHLWLNDALPDSSRIVKFLLGMALTIGISAASYRWLERPVIRGGLRALLPSVRVTRAAVSGAVVLVVAGAFTVGDVPSPAVAANAIAQKTVPLVPGQPRYKPGQQHLRVAMIGDSVPHRLVDAFPSGTYTDLTMIDMAVPGCDLMNLPLNVSETKVLGNPPQCVALKKNLTRRLRANRAQALVIYWGTLIAEAHRAPDGAVLTMQDPSYRARVIRRLSSIRRSAVAAGVKQIQVVTIQCRTRNLSQYADGIHEVLHQPKIVIDEMADPVKTNTLLKDWAKENNAPVLNLYGQLCDGGFHPSINGIKLYDDSIHFSAAASPMIWTWLAPQIRSAYKYRAKPSGTVKSQ